MWPEGQVVTWRILDDRRVVWGLQPFLGEGLDTVPAGARGEWKPHQVRELPPQGPDVPGLLTETKGDFIFPKK